MTGSGTTRKLSRIDATKDNEDARGMPSTDNYYEYDANGDLVVRPDKDIPADKRKLLERYIPLVRMAMERGLLNSPCSTIRSVLIKLGGTGVCGKTSTLSALLHLPRSRTY